jgi:glutamate-ammonia-ligase adenylyltransferase
LNLFKSSGDPVLAELQWRALEPHFPSKLKKHPETDLLLKLLGNSRFLVDCLVRTPSFIEETIDSPYLKKPKDRKQMDKELNFKKFSKNSEMTVRSVQKTLRQYKYREMIRIGIREISDAPFEEIGLELSHLAASTLEFAQKAALQMARLPESTPFTVLGLGKLGGGDLNFSSDIDLIFIFDAKNPFDAKGPFQSFCRLSETICKMIEERTDDGFAFRVDLDLRPEGKSGPIVNSLDALLTYYEITSSPFAGAASWERAALLKADPVAGDLALGTRTLKELEPFVYRKLIDASIIGGLKTMKEKIDRELKKSMTSGFNVKLGAGGIREIEFFVTAFQLVYGGKEVLLQERNTLKALKGLKELKLLPPEEEQQLREAYIFLRRVENRMQMLDERQVHTLPSESSELKALARRMKFTGTEDFLKKLEEHRAHVSACFEKLAP